MNQATQAEIQDYMVALLKIWERTPADQAAVFNDKRITETAQWSAAKVRAAREHCSSKGWLRYQFEGSQDYTLTPEGLGMARGARRNQSFSSPRPS